MATRKISTKLAVEGESEYIASLSRINSSLKALQSDLKLTESRYSTNANSIEALTKKDEALNRIKAEQKNKVDELRKAYDNAKSAEETWKKTKEDLQKKLDENNKALEKLKTTTGDTSAAEKALNEENKKLHDEIDKCNGKIDAAAKGADNWKTQLNNAEIALGKTDAELAKNQKYLDEAKNSSDGCAHSIDEFGKEVDETSESLKSMGTILASEELANFAKKILDGIQECTNAFSDFEAAMAGVKRTTGMSDTELDALGESFKKLATEMPITTEALAGIATSAGQLGIAKENIEGFTVVMAKLATTTDLSADAAATMLAQFANITGISTPEEYERLGATVAALGDSTATTASKVVDMSQGLAAAANLAGMGATDILAISAAVGSLGIEAAAGSTAMSTLITTLYKATVTGGEDLEKFAAVAGMTGNEFRTAWGTDAAGALDAFITGLGNLDEQGGNAILTLEDLGITNVRQTKAVLGLASAEGLLTSTITAGREAWESNTALSDKAAVMYDTLKAKTEMLDGACNNLKIEIGEALAPTLGSLIETGTDAVTTVTNFVDAHPDLAAAIITVVTALSGATAGIAAVKAAYKTLDLLGMTGGIKAVAGAFTAAGGGAAGFVAALGTIGAAALPVIAVIGSLTAIISDIKQMDAEGFLGEGKTIEEYTANVRNYEDEIRKLEERYESLAMWGGDLTAVQHDLDLAKIGLTHATQELSEASEKEAQTAEEAAEAEAEASEAVGELTEAEKEAAAVADAVHASLQELASAYREAYDECRESLDKQIGLFDDFTAKLGEDTDSAAEMLTRWGQQVENLSAYSLNLKKAAEYGLDKGLVQSLADGSSESAGYLAVLIGEIESCASGMGEIGTSAQDAVDKINAAYGNTGTAKDELAETMTAINEDVAAKLDELQQEADSVGFEGFTDAAAKAFEAVGKSIEDATAKITDGISGTSVTAETEMGAVKDAIGESAEPISASAEAVGQQAADALDAALSESPADAANAMTAVCTAVSNAAPAGYSAGYSVGAAIAQGASAGIAANAAQVAAQAAAMVSAAIGAAKTAADSHSPSRKMVKLGEDLDDGMIIGVERRQKKMEEAMQKAMNAVLKVSLEVPEIQDRGYKVSEAIYGDSALTKAVDRLAGKKGGDTNVSVTQIIHAEDTSYAGQQREAKRRMQEIARELAR